MSRQFTVSERDRVAFVTWDSGRMNTLSSEALAELGVLVSSLSQRDINGVVLLGNHYGLGAGANVFELLKMTPDQRAELIDVGNLVLNAIAASPIPFIVAFDGVALGGAYELALACHAIFVTEKSKVGLPETGLHIIPGLGGTQRLPRRMGIEKALPAILEGRKVDARTAFANNMVDGIIPNGEGLADAALAFLRTGCLGLRRERPADLDHAEEFRSFGEHIAKKGTKGRSHPRAPYVALDVIIAGANKPISEGIEIERKAFLPLAESSEGQAGMRLFCARQQAQKLPKGFPGKSSEIRTVGVAGIDGFMGNAIAYLAMQAECAVVGYVPFERDVPTVASKLRAKFEWAVKQGKMTREAVEERIERIVLITEVDHLSRCDLVVEALLEDRGVKERFFYNLGRVIREGALVASNSSSMGPAVLVSAFADGGGDPAKFFGLHFFSPAERPSAELVEIIVGSDTSPDTVATVHAFVRKLGKTPVILKDGSVGFLVNAGLLAYYRAAEQFFLDGTPMPAIDAAMRDVFPMGPFELADFAGVDVYARIFDFMAEHGDLQGGEPLVWKLRSAGRLGMKTNSGFYDYDEAGKKLGFWNGITEMIPTRGDRVASDEEIISRCLVALHNTANELHNRGIVASEEECDLAFMLGIGYASDLGGPIFWWREQAWSGF